MDTARAAVRLADAGQDDADRVVAPAACQTADAWPSVFRAYAAEPLAQRPAGSTGKRGVCRLAFAVRSDTTRLGHAFVCHPFHCTRPWYLDPAVPGMAVVYVQTPAGGLIQGDRAELRFSLDAGAQVHVTNQAAEKIHTMTANCALQRVGFSLGPGAYAEYCPEPLILFPGARFGQALRIELAAGASFLGTEIVLSRAAADGATFAALSTSLSVLDAERRVLIRDHSLALPGRHPLDGPGVLAGCHVWGQAFLVGPDIPAAWAHELQADLADLADLPAEAETGTVWGVSVLPQERGISVKVVGSEVPAVRRLLFSAWHWLRLRHRGVPAPRFPK